MRTGKPIVDVFGINTAPPDPRPVRIGHVKLWVVFPNGSGAGINIEVSEKELYQILEGAHDDLPLVILAHHDAGRRIREKLQIDRERLRG